jgi:putative zinc finger/helix-turn-helix YgiT family protein
MKLRACSACQAERLAPGEIEEARTINGQTYKAKLAGIVCQECGETYLHSKALERFEYTVASALVAQGEPNGEAFKFLRKTLGIPAKELARWLGLAPETISRWETGQRPPDHAAFFLLGVLVREALAGRHETIDLLRATQEPRLATNSEIQLGSLS